MQDQNQEETDQEINEMLENFEQTKGEKEEDTEPKTENTKQTSDGVVIDGETYSVHPEVSDELERLNEKIQNLRDEVQAKQRTINKLNDRLSNLGPQARVGNR